MNDSSTAAPRAGVIVLGSVNTDFVVRVDRLPKPGETVLGGAFLQAAGGKGANQAVAAARLARRPVVLLAALGGDPLGAQARESWRVENLDTRHVATFPDAASGAALIVVDERGENQIAVAPGANSKLTPAYIDALPAALFREAKVLLASLEVPLETVARAISRAKEFGVTTILNPAPACGGAADAALLRQVDVLTPNESEAEYLSDVNVRNDDAVKAARRLVERGCQCCLVTLGAAGCLLLENQGEPVFLKAPAVAAVDTTAAGDAFNGCLAVGIDENRPLIDAARWANRAAAISVTRQGAQPSLPYRREVEP